MAEQLPFKQLVPGSSPGGLTDYYFSSLFIFLQILAIFLLVIVNFKLDSLEITGRDLESQKGMTEEDFVAFLPRDWGDQEVPESRLAGVVKAAEPQESVLSVSDEAEPLPSVPLPSAQPSKKGYLIAAVGDSMVQTMGDSLEYLGKAMREILILILFSITMVWEPRMLLRGWRDLTRS